MPEATSQFHPAPVDPGKPASEAGGKPTVDLQSVLDAKMHAALDEIVADYKARFESMAQTAEEAFLQAKKLLTDQVSQLQSIPVSAEVEQAAEAAKSRIAALIAELEKGGIVSRLHALELAVASQAAPVLGAVEHDAHGLLQTWFDSIKSHFLSQATQAKAEKSEPVVG